MAYCCVPYCRSKFTKKSEISFHEFPCEIKTRLAWIRAICRKDFVPNDTSNYSRVCSIHFKKDDYVKNLKYRILKPGVVPTIFPGYPSWHKVKVPVPKIAPVKPRLSSQKTQVPSVSNVITECKLNSTMGAGAKSSNSNALSKLNEQNNEIANFRSQSHNLISECKLNSTIGTSTENSNSNALSKCDEPNNEIDNYRNQESQTKSVMAPDDLKEKGILKKLLTSKDEQVVSSKQNVATLNRKPQCSEDDIFEKNIEEYYVLEDEGSPEKSRNESQKILFISSGSNNVCIDETDMETILKAMNGEDITTKNEESSSSAFCETVMDHSDTDHPDVGNDDSRSNDAPSEIPVQILNVQGNSSQDHAVSGRRFTSILAPKKKDDDKQLPSKIGKTFPTTKEPGSKCQCNCKKDEVDLYATLLATKLRSLDQKSRHVAMNKIDNMIFKMKMEHFEGQQRPQNASVHPKSTLNPKE